MWRELQMGNKRIGPMRRIAKKQINKEIRKQERHERRTLDIEEKREIKNNVLKKMRTRAAIFGAVGVLGIGAFALYNVNKDNIKELGEGTKVETEMENDTNPRDEFVKGLTVEIPEGIIDEVKTEVFHEVRELKTPEDILNYTKQIYIDKYNENNNTDYGIEDVKFYKTSADKVFYKDEQGILRYCSASEYKEMGGKGVDGNLPVIEATISDGEKDIVEKVAQQQNGEIVNIYKKDEIVEDKETTLSQMGKIVLTGIDYSTSIKQENTYESVKQEYQDRFVTAISDYKKGQEAEKENPNTVNGQIQQEDDERY